MTYYVTGGNNIGNYPSPPLVLPRTYLPITYTPIIIKYVPAVIADPGLSSTESISNPLRLVIHSPTSKLPGIEQSISKPISFNIPPNGLIKLKLLPSNLYIPVGKYTATIFEKGNKAYLERSIWVVPQSPAILSTTITRGNSDLDNITNLNIFSISSIDYKNIDSSISNTYTYELDGNSLVWGANRPPEGTRYTIMYQPAVTLNELIKEVPEQ